MNIFLEAVTPAESPSGSKPNMARLCLPTRGNFFTVWQ